MQDADSPLAHPSLELIQDPAHNTDRRVDYLLDSFRLFIPSIDSLAPLAQSRDIDSPDYVGQGLHSMVYKFEQDSHWFTARFLKRPDTPSAHKIIEGHLQSAAVCGDLPVMQKTFAGSYEQGVVISEYVEGKTLHGLTEKAAKVITNNHMRDLVSTVITAKSRGVLIDALPLNILYGADGFRLIDYDFDPDLNCSDTMDALIDLARMVNVTQLGDARTHEEAGRDGYTPDSCKAAIIMLDKLSASVKKINDQPEEDISIGLEHIDQLRSENKQWLEMYAPSEALHDKRRIGNQLLRLVRR